MGTLQIDPHWRPHFERQGLDCFSAFFSHAEGEIVCGHHTRNVVRVDLAGLRAYLKRQYRIPLKEYCESWWAGFGLVSKSGREWQALHALRRQGIGCPQPLAYGEERGQAFLLVRELPDAQDLGSHLGFASREAVRERRKLARTLGRACARLHAAGFTHPDLYAKHVFVRAADLRIAFIDLQRTGDQPRTTWAQRWRDLAALNASLGDGLAASRDRLAFLLAYLEACGARPFRRLFRQALEAVARRSKRLLRRPRVDDLRRRYDQAYRIESCRVTLIEDEAALEEPAVTGSLQGRW
jgi:tRNA A-37 threonylcarbamoyl transferase component Bud32